MPKGAAVARLSSSLFGAAYHEICAPHSVQRRNRGIKLSTYGSFAAGVRAFRSSWRVEVKQAIQVIPGFASMPLPHLHE